MDHKEADNHSESLTSSEWQLTRSTAILDVKTEFCDVETLSTSVPSPMSSFHIVREPTSELTVIEPEHHDDVVCTGDSITTAEEPDLVQDAYQTLWSSSKDTLSPDKSTVNTSMEIRDSAQTTHEQSCDTSQDVTCQKLSSQDVTVSQGETYQVTNQVTMCQETGFSQDVSVSQDTLGSTVNIPIKAPVSNPAITESDQRDNSQDVMFHQLNPHDTPASQEETPRPELSSDDAMHKPNICYPISTELPQDVPVPLGVTSPSTCKVSSDPSRFDLTYAKGLSDSVSRNVLAPFGDSVGDAVNLDTDSQDIATPPGYPMNEVINPVTGRPLPNMELNTPPRGSPLVTSESAMQKRPSDYTKEEVVSPAHLISVFTVTRSNAEKAKERLTAFGLSERVYHANLTTFYPLVTSSDDLDFINFIDIVNSNCSVLLNNFSADDIKFEQELLKASPPLQCERGGRYTDTSANNISSDNEKDDPTYGTPKQGKISHRPRRKPSSNRMAAQLIINKS